MRLLSQQQERTVRGAFSLAWVVLVVFAPAALFYFVDLSVVNVIYWISILSISITNVAIFLELLLAPFWDRYLERSKAGPVDFGTRHIVAMVSAYLPNEIDILSETIQRMIAAERPTEHTMLTVLIDHNGGKDAQVKRLEGIVAGFNAELGPDAPVRVVEVENKTSRSKAENINYALDYMRSMQPPPEMVALYDADHQPAPDVFVLAAGRLESSGADVLQGRAIIHQGYPLIALEYDIIYTVFWNGGQLLRGWGLFGGSNGYWRFEVLSQIGMDETRLTEDIDSSFRALRAGYLIEYDSSLRSYEEAPPSLYDLFRQRLRWAQGWGEVTEGHCLAMFANNPYFTLLSRIGVFMLLPWREVTTVYVSHQALLAGTASIIRCGGFACINKPLLFFAAQVIVIPWLNVAMAYKLSRGYRHPDLRWWHYVVYAAGSPVYETLKFLTSVLAHGRNLVGMKNWRVTKRKEADGKTVASDMSSVSDASVATAVTG
ncbi:hypothetical protein BU14_0288s0022 [Porphyra umbilicalis]|uniref:Glycosyltransferase 2-like domain-containing protein n=1 Tax=Porphyra umbilicalis TaxID=2786 RepID=A0A1X6P0S7_PORUM|nr:hypothetical protein BU14_0288s0022 [Porphyra umbilicalis]|eukprot:OSX74468.1 hypothetical protein BU14_0288s0022 [Porphyra umbilicalis]